MFKKFSKKQYKSPCHRLYLEGKFREGVPVKAVADVSRITSKGVLLKNVRILDCIENHLWVLPKDGLKNFKIGERIVILGDVLLYYKSDGSYDFALTHITKLSSKSLE